MVTRNGSKRGDEILQKDIKIDNAPQWLPTLRRRGFELGIASSRQFLHVAKIPGLKLVGCACCFHLFRFLFVEKTSREYPPNDRRRHYCIRAAVERITYFSDPPFRHFLSSRRTSTGRIMAHQSCTHHKFDNTHL